MILNILYVGAAALISKKVETTSNTAVISLSSREDDNTRRLHFEEAPLTPHNTIDGIRAFDIGRAGETVKVPISPEQAQLNIIIPLGDDMMFIPATGSGAWSDLVKGDIVKADSLENRDGNWHVSEEESDYQNYLLFCPIAED